MKACGVYLRVSTDRQTVENQRSEVERMARARGYEPVVYEETESAAKARPVLDRMLADVRADCPRPSRCGRWPIRSCQARSTDAPHLLAAPREFDAPQRICDAPAAPARSLASRECKPRLGHDGCVRHARIRAAAQRHEGTRMAAHPARSRPWQARFVCR
jgi:hypothetical protein